MLLEWPVRGKRGGGLNEYSYLLFSVKMPVFFFFINGLNRESSDSFHVDVHEDNLSPSWTHCEFQRIRFLNIFPVGMIARVLH